MDTYANLKTSIADWLNRSDLTSVIPTFISLAEAGMNRNIRHYKMHKRSNAQVDTQYTAVPADFLETVRFQVSTAPPSLIEPASTTEIMKRRYENSDTAGRPTLFSMVDSQFEMWPTPDATYDVELLYYAKIPSLSDTNTVNWLLTEAADVYLYGSLLQAAPYLQDDARLETWAQLYAASTTNLIGSSETARNGGSLKIRVRTY
tara:strand:+ start:1461 stop:2072 length:612 start_codon:yes stop_codon:yes gene_type:complete